MSSILTPWPQPLRWTYTVGDRSWASLQANIGNVDVVSPNFFRLSQTGQVTGGDQPNLTKLVRSHNLRLVPMIQNDPLRDAFNAIMSNSAQRQNIVNAIVAQVQNLNLDGIQVDFETLNLASRPLLTDFMSRLFQALNPLGKLTSIALVSRTPQSNSEFSAAYDYPALAPVIDLATIMTYDFAWPGGPPGAVAPIGKQETVMNYAVSCFGADKLLLGVPFYGYDWNLTGRQSDSTLRAPSRTLDETLALQTKYGGTVRYDEAAQAAVLDYVADGQKHQLWFDNARSLGAKFALMQRLGLRGFAAWRMGHDGAEMWPPIAALAQSQAASLQFPQTGQAVQGPFRRFWERNGGLPIFGYPISDELDEPSDAGGSQTLKVQYFERAKFEHHPELPAGQDVLLTLLGRMAVAGREAETPFQPIAAPPQSAAVRFFPETSHSLHFGFKDYWEKKGGLAVYGFPLSEEFSEVNRDDGKTYTVQYFERARFEFHPELPPGSQVLLGLLGKQALASK